MKYSVPLLASVSLAAIATSVTVPLASPARAASLSLTASEDTYIDSRNPTANFGSNQRLYVGQSAPGSNPSEIGNQTSFLKFALPNLLPNQQAVNVQAKLSLQGTDNLVNVSGGIRGLNVLSDWSESSLTYNSGIGLVGTTSLFNGAIVAKNNGISTYSGNGLNDLVGSWLNGGSNFGLALSAISTFFQIDRSDSFDSSETTLSFKPTLDVSYDVLQRPEPEGDVTAVPEPSSLVGLLAIGAMGTGIAFARKQKS